MTIEGRSPRTECGMKTQVYSRVCGYFSPVSIWNKGKQQEFRERLLFTDIKDNERYNCKNLKPD